MKSFCYDFEKAKNEKQVVNVVAETIKIIIIGVVAMLCAIGIAIYFPQVWVLGPVLAVATLAFVIYSVLRIVNVSGTEKMSVVQGNNGELYIFKNNNSLQNSWIPMVNTFFKKNLLIGAGLSALAVKDVSEALKIQNAIKEIMSNEQFLNHIIENPKDKICNGIEKYKV